MTRARESSTMIQFQNVSKFYGDQDILRDVSFQINPGERVGIVGPNGAGKSTIFRLIVDEEQAEAGQVTVPKSLTIGYLRQQVPEAEDGIALRDFALKGVAEVLELEAQVQELQARLPKVPEEDRVALLDRIGVKTARFGDSTGPLGRI